MNNTQSANPHDRPHNDLLQLHRAIAYSLRGLDSAQTQLRPTARPDRWSIQQIVEHLLLTYSFTETAVDIRLKKRKPTLAKPSLLQRFSQYTVTRLGYFPHGRKAPAFVMPICTEPPISGEELTQTAGRHLQRLDQLFYEGEDLFGSSRCVTHHVLGSMSIPQWRRFHLIHGEHHVKQILAIRKAHNL